MHVNSSNWKTYVTRLCREAWSLDHRSTAAVLASLETLSAAEDFDAEDVAQVLYAAGVTEQAADLIAPSIRVAMAA